MEKRTTLVYAHEVRTSEFGAKKTVSGIAARYGVLSNPLPVGNGTFFRERIAPGAFSKVLATNPDVVALFNHDGVPLGRTTSGTLQLRDTNAGLAFTCELPKTKTADELYEAVKRGDVNSCSFAFGALDAEDQEWAEEEDDTFRGKVGRAARIAVRTIRNFKQLFDISMVTTPAYPGTSVGARNLVANEVRSQAEAIVHRIGAAQLAQRERHMRRVRSCEKYGLPENSCYEAIVEARNSSIASVIARRRAVIEL